MGTCRLHTADTSNQLRVRGRYLEWAQLPQRGCDMGCPGANPGNPNSNSGQVALRCIQNIHSVFRLRADLSLPELPDAPGNPLVTTQNYLPCHGPWTLVTFTACAPWLVVHNLSRTGIDRCQRSLATRAATLLVMPPTVEHHYRPQGLLKFFCIFPMYNQHTTVYCFT